MNNKMVGVVLKGCEEEPDVIRGSKKTKKRKLKMEVAHFGRSIEVLVVNCAWWDHLPPLE